MRVEADDVYLPQSLCLYVTEVGKICSLVPRSLLRTLNLGLDDSLAALAPGFLYLSPKS